MKVIKLSRTDISEIVKRTVRSILSESVSEVMGSAMAGNDDVIQDIVNYIKQEWNRILQDGEEPADTGSFTLDSEPGFVGRVDSYIILIPYELTSELGIAEQFDFNVEVQNFFLSPDLLKYFGLSERSTKGTSYGGGEYDKYLKPRMRVRQSRIDLTVTAVNDELQVQGLMSTMYHELNHNMTQLQVKVKKEDQLDGDELDDATLFTMSKRRNANPHYTTERELHPDPLRGMLQTMTYRNYTEAHRGMNFIFYGLWETTERNARAEAIYGDLMSMNSKRENFKEDFKKTYLFKQINEFKTLLAQLEEIPAYTNNWNYAASVMNMNRRGVNKEPDRGEKFLEKVKARFIKRSYELLDILYKKGMKVAEYYYQQHEPKKAKSPLEKYKENKARTDDRRNAQNLLRAIFGDDNGY